MWEINSPTLGIDIRKEKPMRGLYAVFPVNLETEDVEGFVYVVASDEQVARLKAIQYVLKKTTRVTVDNLEEFEFIVRRIADVQAKRA